MISVEEYLKPVIPEAGVKSRFVVVGDITKQGERNYRTLAVRVKCETIALSHARTSACEV